MKRVAALEIDIGISKIHAVIVSLEDGALLAEWEESYSWDVLEDQRGEINPDKIWLCAQNAVGLLLSHTDLSEIALNTISFSCFGDCFVAVDANGFPTYPMLQFSDLRAAGLVDELNDLICGKPYAEITGGPLTAGYVFSKIYWMKKNVPEVYQKSRYFFNIQQYMLSKLGLEPLTDYGMAARKMLFDVKEHRWSPELCNILEKDPSSFGKTAPAATVVGTIRRFGKIDLPCEMQVVLGAHDAQCGYMGLGVRENNTTGIIANNAGTYNLFGTLSTKSIIFDTLIVTPGCGPTSKSFHYQSGEMIGPTISWFTDRIAHASLSELFAAAKFDASCSIRMTKDPMTGNGKIEGLSVRDGIPELFTGFIESLTFPMKDWLRAMNSAAQGCNFQRMRIGAGGAKSPAWIQLKADILGLPVEKVENLQASSVGLAMICAVATGIATSYDDASERMVRVDRVFEPNQENHVRYQERYEAFRTMI